MSSPRLILASASPRRQALLRQLGLEADVITADIDETPLPDEAAERYVERLAQAKAETVAGRFPKAVIIAADTIIALDGNLLGKPRSKEDAMRMWRQMSGREHWVLTAVAVTGPQGDAVVLNRNRVVFAELGDESMEAYWQTGEPEDKAGAYAIQGYAACWIKYIEGSYSGIMGLPLYETAELLHHQGIKTLL